MRAPGPSVHSRNLAVLVIVLAGLIGLVLVGRIDAQQGGVSVYTSQQVDALLQPLREDIADLERMAHAHAAPTAAPTIAPTTAPTQPPVAAAARGFALRQYDAIDPNWLNWAKAEHGITIVNLQMVLRDYRTRDLDAAVLDRLRNNFLIARNAGVAVVVRLSYWFNDGARDYRLDALPAQAHRHVDQVAPIFNANADIIPAIESGMIGLWGEAHYDGVPGQYQTYGERHQRTAERRALFLKQFAAWQPRIAFRYATDIHWLKEILAPADWARVAWHRDAVLTEPMEWGTYQPEAYTGNWGVDYKQWMHDNFLNTPRVVGGEFGQSTDFTDAELRAAVDALRGTQYRIHSYDSGPVIIDRLTGLGIWDDFERGVKQEW